MKRTSVALLAAIAVVPALWFGTDPAAAQRKNLDVIWDVSVIAQTKSNDCWTAAAAMLVSWKTHIETSGLSMAQTAGPDFLQAYRSDSGLFGQDVGRSAMALHLKVEAPQNFSAAGYRSLLQRHGPLWAGSGIFSPTKIYRHLRIVTGIDAADRLHLIDPNGGRIYVETVPQFARELETIAHQDLGSGADLRPQLT